MPDADPKRNLADQIRHASTMLTNAREDGGCDRIMFWTRRRDELLDQWNEAQPMETAL